jgi:hypothetical protein
MATVTQAELDALKAEVAKRAAAGTLSKENVALATTKLSNIAPVTSQPTVVQTPPTPQYLQSLTTLNAEQKATGLASVQAEIAKRNAPTASTISTPTVPEPSKITPEIPTTTTSSVDFYQQQLDALKKQREALNASQLATGGTTKTGYEGVVEALKNQPSLGLEAKAAEEASKAGISALETTLSAGIAEANAIKTDLQTIESERLAETEAARTRLTSMENITSDINEINYKYDIKKSKKNAELTTKLFELDLAQGQLTQAQNKIDKIVEYYTADKKAEVDKFEKIQSIYATWIDSLNNEEKTILNNAYTAAQKELETAKEEKKSVLTLMVNNPQAGILSTDTLDQAAAKLQAKPATDETVIQLAKENPQANISTKDTIDEALAKIQANPKKNTQIVGSAETGYSIIAYDDTGKVSSVRSVIGGTGTGGGTGGLTQKQQGALAEDLVTTFDGITSREEALKKANSLNTYYSLTYGGTGLNKLNEELDRLYPAPIAPTQTKTTPSNVGAYQAGTATKKGLAEVGKFSREAGEPLANIVESFGSYLGGLFGE